MVINNHKDKNIMNIDSDKPQITDIIYIYVLLYSILTLHSSFYTTTERDRYYQPQ